MTVRGYAARRQGGARRVRIADDVDGVVFLA